MGACKSKNKDIHLLDVPRQDLMMDNDEVKVIRVRDQKMLAKKKGTPNEEIFDGFLQRRSYFVIPKVDKLKKEKIELKQQLTPGGRNHQYPKMRVVGAGEDLTRKNQLYYVSAI